MSADARLSAIISGEQRTITPHLLHVEQYSPDFKFAQAVRKIVHDELRRRRKPMMELAPLFSLVKPKSQEPDSEKSDERPDPPYLHYGIAVSMEDIWSCARRHGVAPEDIGDEELSFPGQEGFEKIDITRIPACNLEVRGNLLDHIQGEVGRLLQIKLVECLDKEKSWVFALYSNYDTRPNDDYFPSEEERAALSVIADQLGCELGSNAQAMWYWDSIRSGLGYSAPWNEYNIWPVEENTLWSRDHTFEKKTNRLPVIALTPTPPVREQSETPTGGYQAVSDSRNQVVDSSTV